MVVAPYNAQVRLLRERRCRTACAVGTVDAFQGQEAPVVIFSMATSTGEDVPRDIGFLFSRNRLNVAISRARCLAILVLLAGAAGDEGAHDRGHAADLDAVRASRSRQARRRHP